MKLSIVHAGLFKLDGGAMFGVVPKVLWERMEQPDENNYCTWAMRCLLIETGDRKILVDTGLGDKQDEKFRSHFQPHGPFSLGQSLADAGVTAEEITDVFLTHLHFDHVGGAVRYNAEGELVPAFSNARYWTNKAHYDWACTPNPREKASFLKENFVPLQEAGVLSFFDTLPYDQRLDWMPGLQVGFAYGHTEAMMPLYIECGGRTVVYCADLLPSPSHIGLPYVMSYDIRPLCTLQEKALLLEQAVEQDYVLFFEHAKEIEACTVQRDAKGRIRVGQTGALQDFLH